MTPEQKLEQDYKAVFAALRDEKNQQIKIGHTKSA